MRRIPTGECPCNNADCQICRGKKWEQGWKQVVFRVRNSDTVSELFVRIPDTFVRVEAGWAVTEPDQPPHLTQLEWRGNLISLIAMPGRARRLAHWLPLLLGEQLELVAVHEAIRPPPKTLITPWVGGDEAA